MYIIILFFKSADSSSNTSSCNSSTPSSPALLPANTSQTPQAPAKQQFHFPGNLFIAYFTVINDIEIHNILLLNF